MTDYDCWMDDPEMHVSVEKFFEVYSGALDKAKSLLSELLKQPFTETPVEIRTSLQASILTPDEALTDEQKQWLKVLRA